MALTYDMDLTDKQDFETLDKGGKYALPGWYHCQIDDVALADDGKKTPSIKFDMTILAGKPASEAGKEFSEHLYLSDKTRDRQILFAKRLGLITPQDVGRRVSVDWEAAIGRYCVVEVKEEEYTKNDGSKTKSSKVAFDGLYDPIDPKVKDVPKASNGQARQPAVATAAAGKDAFADL